MCTSAKDVTYVHSQMIRPFRSETERYGHYSVAGESVWEHPFLWGSKRTGPDLARVGGRYSDEWHRVHLINPRELVPESNMPGFPWLEENVLDGKLTQKKLEIFKNNFGVPYTDEQVASASQDVAGKNRDGRSDCLSSVSRPCDEVRSEYGYQCYSQHLDNSTICLLWRRCVVGFR